MAVTISPSSSINALLSRMTQSYVPPDLRNSAMAWELSYTLRPAVAKTAQRDAGLLHQALNGNARHGNVMTDPPRFRKLHDQSDHLESDHIQVPLGKIPGFGRFHRKAAQFPDVALFGSGFSAQELGKGVLQHIGACGGKKPPAPLDPPMPILRHDIDRVQLVEDIYFHAVAAVHLPAEPIMEHLVAEPVHIQHGAPAHPGIIGSCHDDAVHGCYLPWLNLGRVNHERRSSVSCKILQGRHASGVLGKREGSSFSGKRGGALQLRGDQPDGDGACHRLLTVRHLELMRCVLQMKDHGPFGNADDHGSFPGGLPLGDPEEAFLFPFGKLGEVVAGLQDIHRTSHRLMDIEGNQLDIGNGIENQGVRPFLPLAQSQAQHGEFPLGRVDREADPVLQAEITAFGHEVAGPFIFLLMRSDPVPGDGEEMAGAVRYSRVDAQIPLRHVALPPLLGITADDDYVGLYEGSGDPCAVDEIFEAGLLAEHAAEGVNLVDGPGSGEHVNLFLTSVGGHWHTRSPKHLYLNAIHNSILKKTRNA